MVSRALTEFSLLAKCCDIAIGPKFLLSISYDITELGFYFFDPMFMDSLVSILSHFLSRPQIL